MKAIKALAIVSIVSVSSMFAAEKAADGAAMFNKYCKQCHGEKGEKHVAGKTAQISALPKDVIVKSLKEYRSGKRSTHGMGQVMKSEVLKNTDAELEALADYIVSLKK
jgi:cytochrome c553